MTHHAKKVTGKSLRPVFLPPRPGDPAFLVVGGRTAPRILHFKPIYRDRSTIIDTAWHGLSTRGRALPRP